MKHLEENLGCKCRGPDPGSAFLDMISEAQAAKEKRNR